MTPDSRDWNAHSLEGVCLRFIVHENRVHHGQRLYDWLLLKARELGIHGGSAFHGIAGFGRHGVLHEQHFWELAGDLPVEVRFVCAEADAWRLLNVVEAARLSLFYAITPARYGIAGADRADWAQGMAAAPTKPGE